MKTKSITSGLKLISGAETLTLDPTDGKDTISKAVSVFPSYLDSDFKSWGLDVKGKPTEKQDVVVYEMIKNGTFAQIYGSLSDNLDAMCLTQAQIIQFVKNHHKWLRTDGYGTLFLFKVGDEFFVALVGVDSDGLDAYVYRFTVDSVWRADYRLRVVVPQLVALAS